jgi:chromosomal replication initiation ATPase DnaA
MERYTFDSYSTPNPWQKYAKDKTRAYLTGHTNNWFFAGGQVGAGKTHLCTAIVGAILNRGTPARYMVWDIESKKLKAVVNDDEACLVGNLVRTTGLYSNH